MFSWGVLMFRWPVSALHSFWLLNNFHCVDTRHFAHPFIIWWMFGLFLPLAIMNNAAVYTLNPHFCVALCFHSSQRIYPGVKLLGHVVTLCLTLWRTARLFPIVVAPFYIPISNVCGLQFSTSSPTLVIICLFDGNHPSGCEVVSHYEQSCFEVAFAYQALLVT